MKELFKDIKNDKTIISAFYINIFFIIANVALVLLFYGKLPPLVPIFNQLPWGEQRLGITPTVFIPVLTSLLILIINIFISALVYKNVPLISRILSAISLIIGILTFIFISRVITLLI
jgi:hypothetical protein